MVSNTLLGILSQELVVGFEVSVEILHYYVKWVLFREPYLLAIYISKNTCTCGRAHSL